MKQHIGIAAIILFATTVAALAMFGPDYTTPMYAATPQKIEVISGQTHSFIAVKSKTTGDMICLNLQHIRSFRANPATKKETEIFMMDARKGNTIVTETPYKDIFRKVAQAARK